MNLYIWIGSLVSSQWLEPVIQNLPMPPTLALLYILHIPYFSTFAIFIDLANNLRVASAHGFKIRVAIEYLFQ